MPATTPAKPPVQRKRNRKRKRRAASSSSSSDASSSEESSDEGESKPVTKSTSVPAKAEVSSSSSQSDSGSDDSSSSSSEENENAAQAQRTRLAGNDAKKPVRRMSPSPSPPPANLPSFLPSKSDSEGSKVHEQELKDRFRQFWMTSLADGFRDDLEEIHKEPNLGTSRLALLIDSLAAGADVFASSGSNGATNEMDVILN